MLHRHEVVIRNVQSPMKPVITSQYDTSNFRVLKEDQDELTDMMKDLILSDEEVGAGK